MGWIKDVAKGEWWLPGKHHTKVPGVLVERDRRFRLELIGTFDDSNLTLEPRRYPVVLGFLANGGEVTLFNCLGTSSFNVPGMFVEQCHFVMAVKGHHFDGDRAVFDAVSGVASGLLAWVNRSGFHVELKWYEGCSPEHSFEWNATYRAPQSLEWEWDDSTNIRVSFGVEGLPDGRNAHKPIAIQQVCFLKAWSVGPTEVNSLQNALHGFNLLVRLLSGVDSELTLVGCSSPEVVGSNGHARVLELQFDRGSLDRHISVELHHQSLIPFSVVEERFAVLVRAWAGLLVEQGEVIHAYFVGMNAKYAEERLLSGANALQRLVESTSGRTSFETAVSAPLREYAPCLADNVIQLLKRTRHYLTHYNPAERADAARGAELANLAELVEAVVACKLLEMLGFSSIEIKQTAAANTQFDQKLKMRRWSEV